MQVKFRVQTNEYVTCRLSQNTQSLTCQNDLSFCCFTISKYFVMHSYRIQDINIFDITLIIPFIFRTIF